MANQPGTLSISDLLAVNNTAIVDFGRADVLKAIALYLSMVNKVVNEQLDMFSSRTIQRAIGVGTPDQLVVSMVDEFGVADAQKISGVAQIGWPLRKHQINRQWTYAWMRKHTPADLARQAQGAAIADLNMVQYWLRKAIFGPTNATFTDNLVDNMSVFVKAFANADGFPIPAAPNGTLFNAATHTHYVGSANALPSDAELSILLANVTEHFSSGAAFLFVTQALGDALIAGAGSTYPNFVKRTYADQTKPIGSTFELDGGGLDVFNPTNRQIGVFKGANVWVKPWCPPLAVWAWIMTQEKPLAFRIPTDAGGDNGDFRPIFDDDYIPLVCESMEREYGLGVQNRVAGAVLSYAGADTTYVMPAI